jgi:hypothetical protein
VHDDLVHPDRCRSGGRRAGGDLKGELLGHGASLWHLQMQWAPQNLQLLGFFAPDRPVWDWQ